MAQYALILAEGLSYPFGIFGEPVHIIAFVINMVKILVQTLYWAVDTIFTANVPLFITYPVRKLAVYAVSSIVGGVL